MKKKERILIDLFHLSAKAFPNQKDQIEEKTRILFDEYRKAEVGKDKAVTMHTVECILPCIAFYKAVIACTNQQEQAFSLIEQYFIRKGKVAAQKIQKICRIPFVYKLAPRIMADLIHTCFGEKSGFEMIEQIVGGGICHIDMVKCPYFSMCSMYDCPELTPAFCNSDDVTYGNMHPKLSWERTKTLGRGDNCCDFILKVKNHE
jgi:hypothetical protein